MENQALICSQCGAPLKHIWKCDYCGSVYDDPERHIICRYVDGTVCYDDGTSEKL